MYKNDRFIKEYRREDSPYRNLAHGPLLLDDFIGDAIEKGEDFKPAQAAMVKEILNLTARYGLSHLPRKVYLMALRLVLFYHMTPQQAVTLYNRYVGDWGGASTAYRFEAYRDGKVVKELVKEPMHKVQLSVSASSVNLTEGKTYDAASVRILAVDENGNVLSFFQEPVTFRTEGNIELIGPQTVCLAGGMGGTYVKTCGGAGEGVLHIDCPQAGKYTIKFTIEKQETEEG